MAFEVDSIDVNETEYFIRYVEPLYQSNDDDKNNEENAANVKSYKCRSADIMNRYFFRNFDCDPPLSFITGLQRTIYHVSTCGLDVLDNAILPLSSANLTKNAEKYIEKLRTENRQKRTGSIGNTSQAPTSKTRSANKK